MKQHTKRNMMVFEAPKELTEKARHLADVRMISTSAICRQALSQYIKNMEMYNKSEITA